MTAYRELYEAAQAWGPRVSRKKVHPKVLSICGVSGIRHFRTALNTNICRGMYLSATNVESPFVKQAGCCVIATARDLNYCWERFVYVKELMHAFDDPLAATDGGEKFETLLEELYIPASSLSLQTEAEVKCFWMALGTLCPETQRLAYLEQRSRQQIDDYAIALELRIPEVYVSRLFEPRYLQVIKHLIN